MCLMTGKEDQRCLHKRCWEFKHYPQYNHTTRAMLLSQRADFEWFRRIRKGKIFVIVPVNPYLKGSPDYGEFRKYEYKVTFEVFGNWPKDWDLFHRSEIDIQFVQFATFKNVFNPLKRMSEKKWYIDVKEAAVFIGPKLDSPHNNQLNTYQHEYSLFKQG